MMTKKGWTGVRKHIDFIVADIFLLQLSNLLGCILWAWLDDSQPVFGIQFGHDAVMLLFCMCLSLVIGSPYKNILKRNRYQELSACSRHTFSLLMIYLFLVFFSHEGGLVSRLTVVFTWIAFFILEIVFHLLWKNFLRRRFIKGWREKKKAGSAVIIITNKKYALDIIKGLRPSIYVPYFIKGIFLDDEKFDDSTIAGIPVLGNTAEAARYSSNHWVDEVVVGLPNKTYREIEKIEQPFDMMGIETHQILLKLRENWYTGEVKLEKYGKYLVTTSILRYIPPWKWAVKRLGDIIGAVIGLIFTGIVYLYVAPKIRRADKGPVIYTSTRIGRNGKPFKFYKFRSMYIDADERKKELLKQNKMQGLMFKMDNDPRIIPGVGEFIRKTSLDEFPQFWNVLKGDMSLVGTRPPTQDEWEQYSENYRIRLTQRPGITGIWQVSGRSDITDFEEIVKMDEYYIENWTLGMDFSILCKTIEKVFKREGAE